MNALNDEIRARILSCADALRGELAQRASSTELNVTEFLALGHLVSAANDLSPSDIARLLQCSRANATKVVARLEGAGFITVHRNPWTPRAKKLRITNAGRDNYARATQLDQPSSAWSSILSAKEAAALARLLARLDADGHHGSPRKPLHPAKPLHPVNTFAGEALHPVNHFTQPNRFTR